MDGWSRQVGGESDVCQRNRYGGAALISSVLSPPSGTGTRSGSKSVPVYALETPVFPLQRRSWWAGRVWYQRRGRDEGGRTVVTSAGVCVCVFMFCPEVGLH